MIMRICADVSRTTKRFSAQDIWLRQFRPVYWSAYQRRLTFSQIYHVMSAAPYLRQTGMWQRSTEYEFIPEYRELVQEYERPNARGPLKR